MARFPKIKWTMSVVLAGVAIWIGTNQISTWANGASTSPGSVDDPLITKSYVDSKITELVKQQVAEQLKGGQPISTTPQPTVAPTQAPSKGGSDQALTVVQLQAGQTLYAGAGAEFIVRTGKTVTVSLDENGVPDVTIGKDLAPGAAVETNHLLIFPRDGRGITPDPKNNQEIYVMVRGSYVLKNADGTKAAP